MLEKNNKEEAIRKLQRELIGPRYAGATLSKAICGAEHIQMISKWLRQPKNFLIIMGSPGTGKTYLCSAFIEWVYQKVSSIRYYEESKLFSRVRASMNDGSSGDHVGALSYMIDDEFIMIDDMASAGITDFRRDMWFHIIDSRYDSTLPTVITTNLTKDQVTSEIGFRQSSRLFSRENTIIDFHGFEDLRQKDLNENT